MKSLLRPAVRGAALLAITLMLAAPVAYADGSPFDPPEARISPPIGASSQDSGDGLLAQFLVWLQARISPPIGQE